MNGEEKAKNRQNQKEQEENFGESRIGKRVQNMLIVSYNSREFNLLKICFLGRIRKSLWNLTEYPETSKAALMLGYCSLGLVIISTITFVLGTFPGKPYVNTYFKSLFLVI